MDKSGGTSFLKNRKKLQTVMKNLTRNGIGIFEYIPSEDRMILYDAVQDSMVEKEGYLADLDNDLSVYPEDRWKLKEICKGYLKKQTEVRFIQSDQSVITRIFDVDSFPAEDKEEKSLIGTVRNVSKEQKREKILQEQVKRDSMTKLYNHFFGKELINEYLNNKTPYASCGMMVVDIDYFKAVNDSFGHLFGDIVLQEISRLFLDLFDKKDILVRAGGDEFVIFLKDISHGMLLKKAEQLVNSVRSLKFADTDYSMTCSVGVCFLPENVSGYTYDQLFENADWALYRAKENGKNRCEFCDNLQRYELLSSAVHSAADSGIDAR